MKADLHNHSYFSDGVLSPREVVRLANDAGCDLFYLTDHDTTNGIDEAKHVADELGIRFEEKKLTIDDVLQSDECFFSGTAAEVVPINSLDNKAIGSGQRGPVTELLQSTYFEQVRGNRNSNLDWHTFIN